MRLCALFKENNVLWIQTYLKKRTYCKECYIFAMRKLRWVRKWQLLKKFWAILKLRIDTTRSLKYEILECFLKASIAVYSLILFPCEYLRQSCVFHLKCRRGKIQRCLRKAFSFAGQTSTYTIFVPCLQTSFLITANNIHLDAMKVSSKSYTCKGPIMNKSCFIRPFELLRCNSYEAAYFTTLENPVFLGVWSNNPEWRCWVNEERETVSLLRWD